MKKLLPHQKAALCQRYLITELGNHRKISKAERSNDVMSLHRCFSPKKVAR